MRTFVVDDGFHFLANLFRPPSDSDVETVVAADLAVRPLAPSVVRHQQRLILCRNHKVDCNVTITDNITCLIN